MKIALVGYGKMGKAIEQILIANGHEISFKISSSNRNDIQLISKDNTDVAIEFTGPETAFDNIMQLVQQGVNVVSGSTGWTMHMETVRAAVSTHQTGFLWASNFSIGVNLFFELNQQLAKMMAKYPQYIPSVEEVHHTQKLDAPSGTAITLAEQILESYPQMQEWKLDTEPSMEQLSIKAIRQDPAPGTHTIQYTSVIDDISICHTAHSREGFAQGAVLAAQYMLGKKGMHDMKAVLFG